MKRRTTAAAALAAAATLATATYLGWPSDHDPQAAAHDPQAVRWLKQYPGGTLSGRAEVTYARRDGLPIMVITFEQTTDGKPDCPADQLCLYAAPSYGYPRATTEACGYVDLRKPGWARRARSIHNNLPGGDSQAGTVGFLRSDGAPPSDANQHRVLTLDPTSRTAADPPDIDYLYHYC